LTLFMPDTPDGLELSLDVVDAKVDFATIGFELSFAGAACSDSPAQLRHRAATPGEAGQLVLELCQFYLELAFAGPGVTGKNVEDEL
jgi:hypothetical protein